jgi:hypothetical protein
VEGVLDEDLFEHHLLEHGLESRPVEAGGRERNESEWLHSECYVEVDMV